MNIRLEVDKTDMAHLKRKLSDRRTKVGRILEPAADPIVNFFDYVGPRIVERAKRNLAEGRPGDDTRKLSSSIRYDKAHPSVKVGAKHGIFVHEGTRPHWPPPDALRGWARRHGIPVYLVGKAIAEKGTKANPFLRDASEETFRKDVAPGIRKVASATERNWGRK